MAQARTHSTCAAWKPVAALGAQNEVKLLLELLPRYAGHVEKHPHTLLVKFFGLYRVIPDNGAKVGRTVFLALERGP